MSFSGTTYNNVAGATSAASGLVVQSAVWNNIHTDLGNALTQVMQQLVSNITTRNILAANGGMEVWQRGAGSSASIAVTANVTTYTADRWYLFTSSNACTVSAQTGLTNGSQLCAQVQRNSGQTGTTTSTFGFPLDTDELYRLRGNKVSLSFVAKTGANWSPTSGTFNCVLAVGTGTVQRRSAGFTNETVVLTVSTNLAAGSAATTITGTSSVVVPTTATQGELQFTWTPTGTAGANDWIQIDDVYLESNLSAGTWTPNNFDRIPFDAQLNMCKRHYQKSFPYSVAPAQNGGLPGALGAMAAGNIRFGVLWEYPVELRATAANTTYNPSGASANWQDVTTTVSLTASIDPSGIASSKGVFIAGATASATDHFIYLHCAADSGI